jgi:hypothetical protein
VTCKKIIWNSHFSVQKESLEGHNHTHFFTYSSGSSPASVAGLNNCDRGSVPCKAWGAYSLVLWENICCPSYRRAGASIEGDVGPLASVDDQWLMSFIQWTVTFLVMVMNEVTLVWGPVPFSTIFSLCEPRLQMGRATWLCYEMQALGVQSCSEHGGSLLFAIRHCAFNDQQSEK